MVKRKVEARDGVEPSPDGLQPYVAPDHRAIRQLGMFSHTWSR